MADDREQELKRLEQELLEDAEIDTDDLLSDLPAELFDTRPLSLDDDEGAVNDEVVFEDEELSADDIIMQEKELSVDDIINETLMEAELPLQEDTRDGDLMNNSKKKASKKARADQKREDRWLIVLMAIASFLCMGIIGVLIYWMEVFLK